MMVYIYNLIAYIEGQETGEEVNQDYEIGDDLVVAFLELLGFVLRKEWKRDKESRAKDWDSRGNSQDPDTENENKVRMEMVVGWV